MARKKLNLAWISNDANRRSTFKKRRRGLLKKVSELATLCDVPACAVIYGPHEVRPEVWPNEPEARQIFHRFQSLPETEKSKKRMNQEKFLHHRVTKLADQLNRMCESNRALELTVLMQEGLLGRGLDGIGLEDMAGLACFVDAKLKAVRARMEVLQAESGGRSGTLMGNGPLCGPVEQGWCGEMMGPVPAQEESKVAVFGSGGLGEIVQPFVADHGFGWRAEPSPWMEGLLTQLGF